MPALVPALGGALFSITRMRALPDIISFVFRAVQIYGPAIDPLDAAPHVWEGMSHAEFLDHCRQQRLLQAGEWSHRAPAVAPKDAEL